MATILDELITRLSFKTDAKGLDKSKKSLGDFKATAIKVAAGVGAILGGGLFLNAIADAADETLKWADANGIAVESIGELEFAVRRQGGSIDGLRGSLANLNKSIGEVERGTGRAKLAFEDYGISVKKANGQTKTADELFVDLNKKFSTLTKAQQLDLAAKLGIDKGTIRLLQTAPEVVAELTAEAKKLGVLSRRDAAAAAEFNDGLENMAQSINAIKFAIGGFVFEPLSKFFKAIATGISFLREHKRFVLILIGVIGILTAKFIAMGIAAAIAWIAAALPLIGLIALLGIIVTAIALLAEDMWAFFTGQSSLIGDLVDKWWPKLENAISSVGDFFKELKDDMVDTFETGIEWIGDMIDKMKDVGKAIFDFLMKPIRDVLGIIKKIPGIGKELASNISASFDANFAGAAPIGLSPAIAGAGGNVDKSTSMTIENLNVDASGGDSQDIAQNVDSALKAQLQNTVEDFDSGIRR